MTTDFRPLRDRLESDLAVVLKADLALHGAGGLYVVLISETALKPFGWFAGLSCPSMHKWLRDDIGARWRGSGPAVLIDDRTLCPAHPQDSLVGVALHEMAHALDWPTLFTADDIGGQTVRHVRTSLFTQMVSSPDEPYHPSPRAGHDWRWIRCLLHLIHRMDLLGWNASLPIAMDREFYGYSSLAEYRTALQGEPARLADLSFTAIRAIDPPQSFLDLYNDDLARWPIV